MAPRTLQARLWSPARQRTSAGRCSRPRRDIIARFRGVVRGDQKTIDTYLLGTTLFRYPRALGDSFRRTALLETLVAGVEGRHFPLRRILKVTRAGNHGLSGTRDRVRTLGDADDRQ